MKEEKAEGCWRRLSGKVLILGHRTIPTINPEYEFTISRMNERSLDSSETTLCIC